MTKTIHCHWENRLFYNNMGGSAEIFLRSASNDVGDCLFGAWEGGSIFLSYGIKGWEPFIGRYRP